MKERMETVPTLNSNSESRPSGLDPEYSQVSCGVPSKRRLKRSNKMQGQKDVKRQSSSSSRRRTSTTHARNRSTKYDKQCGIRYIFITIEHTTLERIVLLGLTDTEKSQLHRYKHGLVIHPVSNRSRKHQTTGNTALEISPLTIKKTWLKALQIHQGLASSDGIVEYPTDVTWSQSSLHFLLWSWRMIQKMYMRDPCSGCYNSPLSHPPLAGPGSALLWNQGA